MPSLAPHNPPQLAAPVPAALDGDAAEDEQASGEVMLYPGEAARDPAELPDTLPIPAALAVSGAAAGAPEAASIPLEASTAAGASPAQPPYAPAVDMSRIQGSD